MAKTAQDEPTQRSVGITDEMWDEIKEAAKPLEVTRSGYIRLAVREKMDRDSKVSE